MTINAWIFEPVKIGFFGHERRSVGDNGGYTNTDWFDKHGFPFTVLAIPSVYLVEYPMRRTNVEPWSIDINKEFGLEQVRVVDTAWFH